MNKVIAREKMIDDKGNVSKNRSESKSNNDSKNIKKKISSKNPSAIGIAVTMFCLLFGLSY